MTPTDIIGEEAKKVFIWYVGGIGLFGCAGSSSSIKVSRVYGHRKLCAACRLRASIAT